MAEGTRDDPLEEEPDPCPKCRKEGVIEYLRDDGPLTWYGCPNCTSTFAVDSTDHFILTG